MRSDVSMRTRAERYGRHQPSGFFLEAFAAASKTVQEGTGESGLRQDSPYRHQIAMRFSSEAEWTLCYRLHRKSELIVVFQQHTRRVPPWRRPKPPRAIAAAPVTEKHLSKTCRKQNP